MSLAPQCCVNQVSLLVFREYGWCLSLAKICTYSDIKAGTLESVGQLADLGRKSLFLV